MLNSLITALFLGLIGGTIPGPILTATFTEILQSGFVKSFRIILWGMLTETIIALISMIILSSIGLQEEIFRALSFVGAAILIYIAYQIWKVKTLDTEERVHFSNFKISLMILANGVFWIYWITVCIPKAIILNETIPFGQYIFLILVEIGWLISTSTVAFIFSRFRKILSHPKIVPIIFKIFSLTFAYFSIDMAYKSTMFFLWK
ncbi:MAG: LysE family transporter [Candidatus Gracilibacteria bacterium]|jgi:threonine/homoserine/homoserine lactone efflux protein